jgi:hypothetical protein
MAFSEKDYILLGSRLSTQRLLEQGGVSVAVARAHAKELGRRFPQQRTDELEGLLGEIRSRFEAQAGAKTARNTGNSPVEGAVDRAKDWILDLVSAADNALEEERDIRDEFHKGGKIGRSVPKITGRLQALLTLAAAQLPALDAWGFGDAELQAGRAILQELQNADAAQEQSVKNLPKATQDLYILNGKAYLLLKKLSRAGKRAFKNDPATAAKLGLDILHRRGHKRNGQEEAPPQAQG